MAVKEASKFCKPIILEPIMKVDVNIPENYFGDILSDLSAKRGKIINNEKNINGIKIIAHVPLAELFGYSTTLRSLTQGRGIYSMEFLNYNPLPKQIEQKLVEDYNKKSKN